MANIGGNIMAVVQVKTTGEKNSIGEAVSTWVTKCCQGGWLGLQSGDSKYSNFKTKIEESIHVFVCDYNADIYVLSVSGKQCRMILKDTVYDVLLIDNPDEMCEQLEVYLRRVGAWNGN